MADAQTPLTDQVTTGATPGAPNGSTPPRAGQVVPLRADPEREYVAGGQPGSGQWYTNLARTAPFAIDDITADFGDDLYDRMLRDPQVADDITILRASILEEGVSLAPAIDDEDEPGYQQAADICDVAARMFDDLDTPMDDVLWQLLQAVATGNRIAEQVYRFEATYTGRQQLALTALKVKPRRSLAFVVDAFNTVLGLTAVIPGVGMPVLQGMVINPAQTPNLLPRDKFAVLAFRPDNDDPRGTSVLRPAYEPWYQKQQVLREYLRYLAQFASPSLVGTTAPDAQPTPVLDADGNPDYTKAPRSAVEVLAEQLANFRNGTFIALPNGATVEALLVQGDGAAFLHAIELYDRQITKAILGQTLASEEGKHQARAAALVHQDILDTIVRQAKRAVCRMLRRDVLVPWVRYNYGPAAVPLTPQVTLGTVEAPDLPALWAAAAALHTSGYLAPSQLTTLDEQIGLPARQAEEVTAAADAQAAATQAMQTAATQPPANQAGQSDNQPPKPAQEQS